MPFPRVMRAFLRQDPDVMMVGEMRDPESLAIGIQAGLTGHLVLSTLHTNNAIESIGRMVDMNAEPYLISGVLCGILAQRLVRRNCPKCSEPFPYSREELESLGCTAEDMPQAKLLKGKGCSECNGSGFKGRIGVYELIVADRALKQAIHNNAGYPELLAAARSQGFKTMQEDGKMKVLQGITTPEEVIKAVSTQAVE